MFFAFLIFIAIFFALFHAAFAFDFLSYRAIDAAFLSDADFAAAYLLPIIDFHFSVDCLFRHICCYAILRFADAAIAAY